MDSKEKPQSFFVYMLRCSDGSLYVGSTDNIERRVVEHQAGKGAKYTRGRGPVRVVYLETHPTRSEAMRREKAVKALGKAGKEKLASSFGKFSAERGPEKNAGDSGDGNSKKGEYPGEEHRY